MAKQQKATTASKRTARTSLQGTPLRKPKPKAGPAKRRRLPAAAVLVEKAIECHKGQIDKYGQPYILHVFGVASRCRTLEEKTVAFLHDTVEDTELTFDELRALGFSERIIHAVDCLTRRKGESYEAFVDRIAPDPLARIVKLADLEDNMDVRRSNRPMKEKDVERMEKYRLAWRKLSEL